MKHFILPLFFVALGLALVAPEAQAQQLFRRSQFMTNPFLSNPAIAGTLPETPITMQYRNQWTGFDGAPETMTLSGHTALPNRIGVGGIVYSDDTGGAIKRTGIELGGSYTIDLNNYDAVSFGLSLMANQWSFDNDLDVWDVEDPALSYGMEQSVSVDAHFGLMVFSEAYAFGFAIPHLIQSSTGLENSPIQGGWITSRSAISASWVTTSTRFPMTSSLNLQRWCASRNARRRSSMYTSAGGTPTWHGSA